MEAILKIWRQLLVKGSWFLLSLVIALAVVFATAVKADPAGSTDSSYAQEDGSMNLIAHCDGLGNEYYLVLTSFSAGGWGCSDGVEGHVPVPIDYNQVCWEQYHGLRPTPFIANPYDPDSVSCQVTITTAMLRHLPPPPDNGGRIDVGMFCQYGMGIKGLAPMPLPAPARGTGCGNSSGEMHIIDVQQACEWQRPWLDPSHIKAVYRSSSGNAVDCQYIP